MASPSRLLGAFLLLLAACGRATQEVTMTFSFSSPAFGYGQPIPALYSCKGRDISPPLEWSELPAGTKSLALLMDDPDAPMGTWVHWVIYNIPPTRNGLEEAIPAQERLADGSLQGKNSWRRIGYGGPCPPSGTHRYYFRLYALDSTLTLAGGATKEQLLETMRGHILAQAEWMGTFTASR
ncbi:MAG: YbhB/YbcL family Raf kinase inhibitor-like protein [Anaerolineales bacterium]